MVTRSPPAMLRQPPGSHKCWAYALSAWLAVTADRRATGPEAIIHACRNYCAFGSDALLPKFIDKVLESRFIRMGWKIVDGADLKLEEIDILLRLGYVYVIADVKVGPFSTPAPSHARLIYKNSDPKLVAFGGAPAVLGVMDPILGDTIWNMSDVTGFRLILGFQEEDLVGTSGTPPFAQWFVQSGGKEQAMFTPSLP